MSIEIREYTKQDWLDFMGISIDEWAQGIKSIGLSILKEYDNRMLKLLLARSEGNLAGFIYGFVLPSQVLIPEFMYIKPEYRHQGIAQSLLAELERQSGCTCSMIFYNKTLHDYYEKQGYSTGENLETAIKQL